MEAAKLRRQRLLRRAMENMGAFPRPGAQGAQPEGAPSGAETVPTGTQPGTPPGVANAEELQLAKSIEGRFAQLQSKPDHFAILGLPRDAPRDQVKTAFLTLAKVFHPDRLPQSLAHLSAQITTVFEAVREAYEVLHDDTKRSAYLASLNAAKARPQPPPGQQASNPRAVSDANELFKRGEVYFKKREFKSADDNFSRAYELDPLPVYLAARAWAIYMDPTRKGEVATVKGLMTDAIKKDPNCDRAHYQLGVIARVEGDIDRAEKHFKDAVRSNPKHLEANQELRLIDMRRKNPPGKKGGLFR